MGRFTDTYFQPVIDGQHAGKWRCMRDFMFFQNDTLDGKHIHVPLDALSNGADIPPPWAVFLICMSIICLFSHPYIALIIALSVAASIAWLFPRIHAEYIAAAFMHDIGLREYRHIFSRQEIDRMFLKAMRVEARPLSPMPHIKPFSLSRIKRVIHWVVCDITHTLWRRVRPYLMFLAVSVWGVITERLGYFFPRTQKEV